MTGSPEIDRGGGRRPGASFPATRGRAGAVIRRARRAVASLASGSIGGVVQDEHGAPIAGAMVSALGATNGHRRHRPGRAVRHPHALTGPVSAPGPHHGLRGLSRADRRSPGERRRPTSSIALRHAGVVGRARSGLIGRPGHTVLARAGSASRIQPLDAAATSDRVNAGSCSESPDSPGRRRSQRDGLAAAPSASRHSQRRHDARRAPGG